MTEPNYVRYIPEVKYLIKTEGNGIILAGTIQTVSPDFPVTEGWLECDGSEYDPEQYPELHAILSSTREVWVRSFWDKLFGRKGKFSHVKEIGIYGKNRLPDFRGRVVR